ncbi:MAG: type VI secretion system baseplate subunit TssG, partial [Acidobacteriota bacterium]
VRARLGPMPLTQYKSFLPGGDAYEPLRSLCRFYCGEDLDLEVQLVLRREDAPQVCLGSDEGPPSRLGWVSWMFTKPLDRDPDETILRFWQ